MQLRELISQKHMEGISFILPQNSLYNQKSVLYPLCLFCFQSNINIKPKLLYNASAAHTVHWSRSFQLIPYCSFSLLPSVCVSEGDK